MNKTFIPVLLVFLISVNSFSQDRSILNLKQIRIGIVVDGPWDKNEPVINLVKKEIKDALAQQADILFPGDKILTGDWTQLEIHKLNDRLLNDKNVDIIIGFGLMASNDLAKRTNLIKPVIAPVIIDPDHKNFPYKEGTSGVKNLSYLNYPGTYERDLNMFKDITPFKNLVIIDSRRYVENLTYTHLTDTDLSRVFGVNVKTITFDNNADDALKMLPPDAQAVYLGVLPLSDNEFRKLADGLIERRLPSFSYFGEFDVKRGIMAAANPDIFPRIARRIALHVQRIISGEDAGTLNVGFNPAKRLFINLKTAYAVGVSPKWGTLLEAELIEIDSAKIKGAQIYNLHSAINKIAIDNLDVLAKIREVSASNKNLVIARGNLFPQIDLSATGLQIDLDRANAGYIPERKGMYDISASQILFSEPVLANISIQSSLIDSKKNELEILRQNSITDGSKIFLNYLRTKKIFYILLENLKLMRANLEIAQNRQSIGSAGPEEPLRWEVEIADLRKTTMEVQSQMNQAMVALKQVLNIPLIYQINVEDISLDDPSMLISNKQLQGYLEDPVSYDILTDYFTNRGLALSQEVKQLNSLMDAQQTALSSIRKSFFLPSLSLFGGYTRTFYKSSVNQPFSLTTLPPLPASIPPEFPAYLGQLLAGVSPALPDNNDWNVGLQLSLNIFNGYSTSAKEEQSTYVLEQLNIQKKSVGEKIALNIRVQMENVKSSWFGIQQSHVEVEAANKNLKLVTDAYSRGVLSILNLIDAQASTLRARQVAVNALYDFFISYIQLQRAIGRFDILLTQQERDDFISDLNAFMKTSQQK
jgi:outer membrane protein